MIFTSYYESNKTDFIRGQQNNPFYKFILLRIEMSQLLQIAGNVTYTSPDKYADLLTLYTSITLVAMAYHPLIQNLLYMLYAIPFNSTYKSGRLQIWQITSTERQIVYNRTLNANVLNSQSCEMDLSSRILLIQCSSQVGLFEIKENGKSLMNQTAFYSRDKSNTSYFIGPDKIQRYAAVCNQKLVYYNSTHINVTIFNLDNKSAPILNYSLLVGSNLFTIFISLDYIIWAQNPDSANIKYIYLPCILYGYNQNGTSCNSNSSSSIVTLSTGYNISRNFRIRQTNSTDSKYVMWVLIDGNCYSYQLSTYGTLSLSLITGYEFDDLTYNNNSILFFNSNKTYSLRSFQTSINISLPVRTFKKYIKMAAINSSRMQLAIFDGNNYQVAHQYLIIENCQNYNAQMVANNCQCLSFDGLFCSLLKPKKGGGLPSFAIPVMAVGAAVAVTLIVILTRLLYKKFCKTPKNNRVPYKYEQSELMSFQM